MREFGKPHLATNSSWAVSGRWSLSDQQRLSFPSALVPIVVASYMIEGFHRSKETPVLCILWMSHGGCCHMNGEYRSKTTAHSLVNKSSLLDAVVPHWEAVNAEIIYRLMEGEEPALFDTFGPSKMPFNGGRPILIYGLCQSGKSTEISKANWLSSFKYGPPSCVFPPELNRGPPPVQKKHRRRQHRARRYESSTIREVGRPHLAMSSS